MKILKNGHLVGSAVVITAALLPIGAHSEEIPALGPIPFMVYDKDGNGVVSEAEFNTVREERMSARTAEGRPMRGARNAPSFTDFDTDGDGQLTPDELAAGQRAQREKRRSMAMGQNGGMGRGMGRNMPAFSDYDLDSDGKIVKKELQEARAKRISERSKQGYPMRNLGNAPSFEDIDVNGDGQISEQEFTSYQSRHRQQRAQ